MGRKVNSKKPMRRKFHIRGNKILTHIVKDNLNNEILGITTTPFRVLTMLKKEKVYNLDNFVVTDIHYNNEIPMIKFLLENKDVIDVDMKREVSLYNSALFLLEKDKARLKDKLRSVRKNREFNKLLYDEVSKTIDKINIKIYETKYTLHKLNEILEYQESLTGIKTV